MGQYQPENRDIPEQVGSGLTLNRPDGTAPIPIQSLPFRELLHQRQLLLPCPQDMLLPQNNDFKEPKKNPLSRQLRTPRTFAVRGSI
jgi:hypothetical protein